MTRDQAGPLAGGATHIIGIGGIGMSAIAEVMAARGLTVQGSDLKDGPNLRRLAAKGIKVFTGHSAENLVGAGSVVISSAVKPGNPELAEAHARGLRIFSRADALAALMEGFHAIAVTGTHGKTTTTSMIGWLLEQAGFDPTVIVGGLVRAWGSNARIGRSKWMVVEADESDGTFIKLPHDIGVVTNIDPEHLDYYGSEEALHAAFETFFTQIPREGLAVAGIDNAAIAALMAKLKREDRAPRVLTFGATEGADVRLANVYTNGGAVAFDVDIQREPGRLQRLNLKAPGRHNALNATAALAVGRHLGIADEVIAGALAAFEGVDRRFTQTGDWNGVAIYDDYAHHPAEIAAVLSAAKGAAKGAVIAVVQPHRFSRLKALFDSFCTCFDEADAVLVAPVYPAGEAPNGFDSDRLVEGLRKSGHACVYLLDGEEALAPLIASLAKPGDLVIGLGAGNITDWARALPEKLKHYPRFAGAAE